MIFKFEPYRICEEHCDRGSSEKSFKNVFLLIIALICSYFYCTDIYAGEILQRIKDRGHIKCGVYQTAGFSFLDKKGNWQGFEVDFCRALAAGVLGNAQNVEFYKIETPQKKKSVEEGYVDIVFAMTTITLKRDSGWNGDFSSVIFYDHQGFMAWSSLGVRKLDELQEKFLQKEQGPRVCVLSDTTTEENLQDYIKQNALNWTVLPIRTSQGRRDAFVNRVCDLVSGDSTELLSEKKVLTDIPEKLIIFDDKISREPIAAFVSAKDPEWFNVVKWVILLTKTAEALNISKANITTLDKESLGAEARRILGIEGTLGRNLGLDPLWAYRILSQVGNYEDIFERNLGQKTEFGLERGVNALWKEGGLHYAYPFR